MVDLASSIVDLISKNPVQAALVLLLLLSIFLTGRTLKKNERLRIKLDEERSQFYIEIFSFLNMVLRNKIDFNDTETVKNLSELDSKLKLFASDKVVLAWADFWKAVYENLGDVNPNSVSDFSFFKPVLEAYGHFQIAVRKDVGSSGFTSGLKWYDFLRSVINDIHKIIEPSDNEYRSYDMKKYNSKNDK